MTRFGGSHKARLKKGPESQSSHLLVAIFCYIIDIIKLNNNRKCHQMPLGNFFSNLFTGQLNGSVDH